ncbi:hypothetical protein [Bradyrhizobium sp. JYMT SZCCT0428]|uniref:hypothetical protein n=1 Tax=Bradyrhizobium sp. JYMT SZCCT0428 TaxID=2807673 RepID=UPI001BA50F56|nr:hypothetical protein [Bradyrhizobium sp. JYMT SZCCT0428]MBR1154025.1 hypothetical protein [Bradyrhizobium sp. JYMT SZCCT0428]
MILVRLARPLLRHPQAMFSQIGVKYFLGELPKVRSEAQALELKFAIVLRTRHDRINPLKSEVSRTPALSLSVVQTTETHHRQDWVELGR